MADLDPEHAVRCPYMPEHVMHIDSLLTHLNRCKATNKHLYKNCIYNSLHVVLRKDYKDHVQNCQDRFSKGEVQDDQWDARHRVKIQKNDQSRNDSDFSSSHDDKSISYHSSHDTDFSFQHTPQSSFYKKNVSNNQRVYPQSFYHDNESKKVSSRQQYVERNISLDFSFRKDNNENPHKIRNSVAVSEKDTCESSYYENNKSLIEQQADYHDVLDLIKGIDQRVKVSKLQKTRGVDDSFGDDLIEVIMRKTEKTSNRFFDGQICK